MAKPAEIETQLNSPEVEQLLVLCEEVMRATPAGAKRFIEPAPGVLSRAKAQQHSIVFGRRGSGKSTLLRKVAADLTVDRRPIAFVDMETFKGHSYPDVLISVLIKSLEEFKGWLEGAATAPATKTSFWNKLFGTAPKRPPFARVGTSKLIAELVDLIAKLEAQLGAPESSHRVVTDTGSRGESQRLNAEIGIQVYSMEGKITAADEATSTTGREVQSTYVSHKVEYLHQMTQRK